MRRELSVLSTAGRLLFSYLLSCPCRNEAEQISLRLLMTRLRGEMLENGACSYCCFQKAGSSHWRLWVRKSGLANKVV
jgi:hypothetical protein